MITERAVALRVGGGRKVEKGRGGGGWKKFEKGGLRNIGEVVFIKQGV